MSKNQSLKNLWLHACGWQAHSKIPRRSPVGSNFFSDTDRMLVLPANASLIGGSHSEQLATHKPNDKIVFQYCGTQMALQSSWF
jgi:hypothetical protein